MRTITTFLICFSLIIVSCTGEQKQDTSIGYGLFKNDEKRPIVQGSSENIAVWEAYIKAHNAQDIEAIKAINADEFKAYGPRGEFIDGNDAHIAFLTEWFSANDPKWKSNWYMTNAINDKDGNRREWITSSHDITLTVEGNTVEATQIHDALIADGKVQMFFVYERAKTEEPKEE